MLPRGQQLRVREGEGRYQFVVPEADAHLLARQFPPLVGAPLRRVRTFVLDTDKPAKGLSAVLTCSPPPNRTQMVGAKQQTRLPNDRKLLNELGTSALMRHVSPRRRGMLWRQSVVWELDYRCIGSGLCDAPKATSYGCQCSVRVRYSATVEQIDLHVVTIEITGCTPATGVLSLHSTSLPWDSNHLADVARQQAPARHASLVAERKTLDELHMEMIARQRRETAAAGAAAAGAAAGADTAAGAGAGAGAGATAAAGVDAGARAAATASRTATTARAAMVRAGAAAVAAGGAAGGAGAGAGARAASGRTIIEPSMPPTTHNMSTEVVAVHEEILVQERAVRVAAIGAGVRHSQAERDKILELMAYGCAPSEIQSRWNSHVDGECPELMYIHGVVNEQRRRGRLAMPPYEAIHVMCKHLATDQKVMLYMSADDTLDPDSDSSDDVRALHLVMCCTLEMVDQLVGADGIGLDAKWRTCEGGGCVIAIGAFHQHRAKEADGRRGEFEAGYVHSRYSPVCVSLSNLDCYFAVKVQLDALRGLLPCKDPTCSHPLRRVDLARGGFVMQRACAVFPPRQVWWKGFAAGQSFSGLLGMIDKCGFERRALVNAGFIVILCDFHAFAAMLEQCVLKLISSLQIKKRSFAKTGSGQMFYFLMFGSHRTCLSCLVRVHSYDKKLCIRDSQNLLMLLVCAKFIARGRTLAEVQERWTVVKEEAIPELGLEEETEATVISYLQDEWMCEQWVSTWTGIGRHSDDSAIAFTRRHFPRTNNATERLWLIYLADVCDYRMFKRRDFELNGITNANGNLRSCLLDTFQVSGNDMDWYGH